MAYPQGTYRISIRVAFLTTVIPVARRSGGEVVDMAFIEALRDAGHDVHVAGWLPSGAPAPAQPWIHVAGNRHIETAEAPAAVKAAWLARAFARGLPYSVAKYAGGSYDAVAAAAADGAELTILNHGQAPVTRLPTGPFVHLAHNVEHDLYRDAAARAGTAGRRLLAREARLMEHVERQLAQRSAAVWCLTAADAARFRELGAARTPVFPVPGRPASGAQVPSDRLGVALIGNWTWEPNAVGLRWFATEVIPRLDPSLPVDVAGAGAEQALGDDVGAVRLHGRVPDADAFLAGARIVAVPARAGGGIQVRTLDALAAGSWVATTPMGVRGLDELPSSVRVEDDPARLAEAITQLARAQETTSPSREGIEWSRRRSERFAQMVAEEAGAAVA